MRDARCTAVAKNIQISFSQNENFLIQTHHLVTTLVTIETYWIEQKNFSFTIAEILLIGVDIERKLDLFCLSL